MGQMRMEPSDNSLVEAALSGDGEAFTALVLRHYDRIYRLAWRVLGSVADAEDVAQDICAALPGKLVSFRREARFTTWLHRIVLNAARDRMRRKAVEHRRAEGWGEVEHLRRAEAAEARAEQEWLVEAMQALAEPLRETVALVLGEDLSHAEAGKVLGVTEGTISWRMSEVRKALRAMATEERSAS